MIMAAAGADLPQFHVGALFARLDSHYRVAARSRPRNVSLASMIIELIIEIPGLALRD